MVGVSRHDMNDLSGSRGEANFVWRCKNCKRESSATIKAAPSAYAVDSSRKTKNVIDIDTRGLEFTDFKADVGASHAARLSILTTHAGRLGSGRSGVRHEIHRHRSVRRGVVRLR